MCIRDSSDPEETSIMLHLYGVMDTPLRHLFKAKGMEVGKMCLFLGFTNGEKGFSKNVAKHTKKVCRQFGGLPLTGYVTKSWEKGRFNDPYLRDTMQDFGIVTDTMECTVNWSNMSKVHQEVREYCKSRPNTICMTHMSHVYPQGANLYWIFITKMSDCLLYTSNYNSSFFLLPSKIFITNTKNAIPKLHPPNTSVGKCTPTYIRLIPIKKISIEISAVNTFAVFLFLQYLLIKLSLIHI